MSADGSINFKWAGEERKFRLAIGQLRELQDRCNAGPAEIMARLQAHRWRVDDLREVIRLGLIGGGMSPNEAMKTVERYVDARPLFESVPPAIAVLLVALVGDAEDEVGKGEAEGAATEAATNASSSPHSTAPAPQ